MRGASAVGFDARAAAVTEGTFFPPVQFSPVWALLALGLVVIVIAFYVVVPLLTRPPRRPAEETASDPFAPPISLGQKYGELIDEVEEAYRAGRMSSRAAHQRLSLLVRYFAFESTGIRAPTMTLSDLREAQAPVLSEAVGRLYPGAFAAVDGGSVTDAARHARRVVQPWS